MADLCDTENEKVKSFLQSIQRDINCLSDGNKMTRRRALEKLQKEIFQINAFSAVELDKVFAEVCKPLLSLYSFPVDRCRELSINMITEFIKTIPEPWSHLPYIIAVLTDRLGGQEIIETTEEIRLLQMQSLNCIITACKDHLDPYVKDIIQILTATILDPFPEVKKESCSCVNKLSSVVPEKFYFHGEVLVRPLVVSVSHQHHKVRSVCLQTIGVVIKGTSGKEVDNVISHIAQRTFDHSPPVRMMVTNIIGDWLLNLRDRYSFFHKLLPLLLTGLSDEMTDIKAKSKDLFDQAGQQYEAENENDLKEKLDFHVVKHFENVHPGERPSLGCRELVQRNFSKILPAVLGDLTDWVVETRIKASQLLYHLIFYAEDHITMHLEPLLQGLYKCIRDEEEAVGREARCSAELVGLYVEPGIYFKLVLTHLQSVSTANAVSCSNAVAVLASLIRGAVSELLNKELKEICAVISSPDVSITVTRELHQELNALVAAVLSKPGLDFLSLSFMLFDILLNIMSMASDPNIMKEARANLEKLSQLRGLGTVDRIVEEHGYGILTSLQENAELWTGSSPERLKFDMLLTLSHKAFPSMLNQSMEIFLTNLRPTNDPELKLKMFSLLSRIVTGVRDDNDVIESLQPFCVTLLKEAVLPNCIWHAGRVAAAVRAAAMSCFWSLLQGHVIRTEHINEVFSDMLIQIISCLDDDNQTTRMVTCKTLLKLLCECRDSFDAERLNKIYPELLKRMDDSNEEIRMLTTRAFSSYFKCFSNYDADFYRPHLEAMFKGLLIHLDDPDKAIQDSVLTALKDASFIHPSLLRSKLNEVRHKHRLSM
eukprot:gene10870-19690_t